MTIALQLKKIKKDFSNKEGVLDNINLTIKSGDFYGLLGSNGAGKSTLIGIISSLVKKTSGTIKIFDCDLEKDTVRAKLNIGLVPQDFNFSNFESLQQILVNQGGYYGITRKEALIRSEKLLRKLGLWKKHKEPSRLLSGGMKRCLMIARALVHKPRILVLDEPTASLDVKMRHFIWNFLKNLNKKGTTIILTTHYLEEAEILCRNIGILFEGKLIKNTSMVCLLAQLKYEKFVFHFTPQEKPIKLSGYTYSLLDKSSLEVKVPYDKKINDVISQINRQGIIISSIRSQKSRLEELFHLLLYSHNSKENCHNAPILDNINNYLD